MKLETPQQALAYTIKHRPRVTKRIHLELDQQGGLVVVAPPHWSGKHINAALVRNATRVAHFLTNARQRQAEPLQYATGGQHLYLGKYYTLKIKQLTAGKSIVQTAGDDLIIAALRDDPERIKATLRRWYRQQAEVVFAARLQLMIDKARWAAVRSVQLQLRRMRRTWGNCSSGGVIKLNTHLVKAALPFIDSVIAHELCHLQEMHHGQAFYTLLQSLNPRWRADWTHLKSKGHVYLLD